MLHSNDEKYALKELLDWWEIKSHKKITCARPALAAGNAEQYPED